MADVGDKRLQIPQVKFGLHHHFAAEIQHRHRGPVEGQYHNGHNGNDPQPHVQAGLHQLLAGAIEFFALMIAPDKGLYHPDGHQIFLQNVVKAVDFLLHGLKEPGAHLH